jgi:hypothetical protein
MAIIKLGPDNFEIVTLATHPARTYSSSSAGVTGSVYVYARRSDYEKDAQSAAAFDDTKLQADSLEDLRFACIAAAKSPTRGTANIVFGGVPQDGDIITIQALDGTSKSFEFDKNGSQFSGSAASKVSLSGITTAAASAAAFNTAIKNIGSSFGIKSKIPSDSSTTVKLTQKIGGSSGNTTISTQYQLPASGSVTNMTVPSAFAGGSSAGDLKSPLELYISGVHAEPVSSRKKKAMELYRFETSFKYTKDTGRKNVVKNIVMPYHRVSNPWSHYAFSNYHTLNFFTASQVPSNSALIYPNYFPSNEEFGPYTPDKGFTIDFYVNPKRSTLKRTDAYTAGCIMHLSSTFAVSLVSGSRKDEHGVPSAFRILLQLSHSADTPPSKVSLSTANNKREFPEDLIFLSKDNVLLRNHWHHVAIRWGGHEFNAGTGSIVVDGIDRGYFVVPSSSIAPINKTGTMQASASFTFGVVADKTVIALTGSQGGIKLFEFDTSAKPGLFHGVSGSRAMRVPIRGLSTGAQIATRFATKVKNSGLNLSASIASNVVTIKHKTGGTAGNTLIITGSGHGLSTQASYTAGTVTNLTASLFSGGGSAQKMNFAGGKAATTASIADPQCLFIGNYFEGKNNMHSGSNMIQFFNPNANTNEGVRSIASENNDPINFSLQHPLNAEIHDIKIYNEYRGTQQILTSSQSGPKDFKNLLFYLPLFFVKESPKRKMLLTPFQTDRASSDDPFNVSLSFGVGGHLLNAENYCREFVQKEYPRFFNLTASVVEGGAQKELTMNEYLYATGSIRARNLLVLPCDNGKFYPNFNLLKSGTYNPRPKPGHEMDKFVNDLGDLNLSFVSLDNLILTSSLIKSLTKEEGSIETQIIGSTDNLGQSPGVVLTVFQRTRDNSSNEVVFFDMSNLFYGKRIKPGSLKMTDPGLTGSITPSAAGSDKLKSGRVPMILRDNGYGNIYRADAFTPHATWNSVGNVYYDEGVILVKSPNIPRYGADQHTITFKGESDVHVMKIMVHAKAGQINSSSNISYTDLSASFMKNDPGGKFVYITGINYHDDNMNVIAKTSFAQAVVKREDDEYLFKSKIDF